MQVKLRNVASLWAIILSVGAPAALLGEQGPPPGAAPRPADVDEATENQGVIKPVERGRGAASDENLPPHRQRRDSPTGRLLDRLAAQNAGQERYSDAWLLTLKEIVDQGPDAVPELIEELDATSDGMMMRCLGFTLRAIGDPRAVPSLIRAIPKTLQPPGSDMGLRADDLELAKFAQEHDLAADNPGNEYDFGRPVREIFGALHHFSRRRMREEELFHMFLDGLPRQQQMKRQLYQQTALKWAGWWEENGPRLVPDPAYHHVNLLKFEEMAIEPPRAGSLYMTDSGGSGWVLESFDAPRARTVFFDCDTGRAAAVPKKWQNAADLEEREEEIAAWAAGEGFDLMGVQYEVPSGRRYYAVRALGLRAWELGVHRWKMNAQGITLESLQDEGRATKDLLLHYDEESNQYDPEAIATFFYITREGVPGLLFVGIEVQDDSLQPGGILAGDNELEPVAFRKGRRFGFKYLEATQ